MRQVAAVAGGLAILCGAWALAAGGQVDRTDDEAAVRAAVERYMDARARGDAGAIRAVLTEDADQFTTSGEWRRGREAVVAGTLEASRRNPGERAIEVEGVRFAGPDVAIVDGPYAIGARRVWTTIVLSRAPDGWRLAAIRNMAPSGPVAPATP
jgi:uncharacterized protein (TIGR02246 family)